MCAAFTIGRPDLFLQMNFVINAEEAKQILKVVANQQVITDTIMDDERCYTEFK